jgi:REP element-mobilizing transposase RayT
MPRRRRNDEPGAWHHVFNRALSKRALFMSPDDYRYFMGCMEGAVESGTIRVHRFGLMINHYHMLVKSPIGRLDSAMHDIQMHYAQYLNRRLGRDGALFSNRYKSRRVTTDAYHRTLVSYIDANPVAAGVVARAEDHPWSSAAYHASGAWPDWLSMDWIDATVLERTGRTGYAACRETFPLRVDPAFRAWVERRLRSRSAASDDLDVVLGPDPAQTLSWMRRQAQLADGEDAPLPVADASAVESSLRAMETRIVGIPESPRTRGPSVTARDALAAGILRHAATLTWAEIAERLGCSASTARARCMEHDRRVLKDDSYASLARDIVRSAAAETVGLAPRGPTADGVTSVSTENSAEKHPVPIV